MSKQSPRAGARRRISENRRARHEYDIEDTFEAGLVLLGTEVKSLRAGKVTLGEGYVRLAGGEAWLVGVHIPEYLFGNRNNHDPRRQRKLLLHAREIHRIDVRIHEQGLTAVPLELYFHGGRVKLLIGIGRGRKQHDKRRESRDRDDKREMERHLRRG